MKIDDNYTLTNDQNGWTLKFEAPITKKNGTVGKTQHFTYHSNMKQALERYLDDRLKECTEISEILAKIEEVKTIIHAIPFYPVTIR